MGYSLGPSPREGLWHTRGPLSPKPPKSRLCYPLGVSPRRPRSVEPPPPEPVRPPGVPEDAIVSIFTVRPERAGLRLDRYLSTEISRLTRTRARAIVDAFAFTLDARPLRPAHRVRADEVIVVYRPRWEEPDVPRTLGIVYEDEHLLAVDKPPGLPVHPTARFYDNTVTAVLAELYPDQHTTLCHRIDRETSGVLLIARSPAAERAMKMDFAARRVHKTYHALVYGRVEPETFTIDAPLRLAGGALNVRMKVASLAEGAMPSCTRVQVLERFEGFTLVAAYPETGRQHQIRVHMAHVGHPLVGDKLYAHGDEVFVRCLEGPPDEAMRALLLLDRHALHAHAVEFAHPVTGAATRVEAPLAADIAAFCAARREPSTRSPNQC